MQRCDGQGGGAGRAAARAHSTSLHALSDGGQVCSAGSRAATALTSPWGAACASCPAGCARSWTSSGPRRCRPPRAGSASSRPALWPPLARASAAPCLPCPAPARARHRSPAAPPPRRQSTPSAAAHGPRWTPCRRTALWRRRSSWRRWRKMRLLATACQLARALPTAAVATLVPASWRWSLQQSRPQQQQQEQKEEQRQRPQSRRQQQLRTAANLGSPAASGTRPRLPTSAGQRPPKHPALAAIVRPLQSRKRQAASRRRSCRDWRPRGASRCGSGGAPCWASVHGSSSGALVAGQGGGVHRWCCLHWEATRHVGHRSQPADLPTALLTPACRALQAGHAAAGGPHRAAAGAGHLPAAPGEAGPLGHPPHAAASRARRDPRQALRGCNHRRYGQPVHLSLPACPCTQPHSVPRPPTSSTRAPSPPTTSASCAPPSSSRTACRPGALRRAPGALPWRAARSPACPLAGQACTTASPASWRLLPACSLASPSLLPLPLPPPLPLPLPLPLPPPPSPPPSFDFWSYLGASMEDDFSRVVGIGVESEWRARVAGGGVAVGRGGGARREAGSGGQGLCRCVQQPPGKQGIAHRAARHPPARPPAPALPPANPPTPVWVTLVIFVLISGPLGWAALIFLCLAAAVLLLTNMKLFSITRCGGGRGGRCGPRRGSGAGGRASWGARGRQAPSERGARIVAADNAAVPRPALAPPRPGTCAAARAPTCWRRTTFGSAGRA